MGRLMTALKPLIANHKYSVGDIVVFRNISWEHEDLGGFFSDNLYVVTKAQPHAHYYEIEETFSPNKGHISWGTDGSDIRPATTKEIAANSRLPKTIYCTAQNPKGYVTLNREGEARLFKIIHYTTNNSLLIADSQGNELEVEIFDITEATPEEIKLHELTP